MTALSHPLDIRNFDLITEVGTNPAAGDDYTYTPPANTRIQLLAFHFAFVTNANVKDRLARFRLLNGGNRNNTVMPTIVQPASKVWFYNFSLGIPAHEETTNYDQIYGNLGPSFIMQDGDTLEINSPNMDAADQLSTIVLRYKQWIIE